MILYYEEALINAVLARGQPPIVSLEPSDFSGREHSEIWKAILEVIEAGEPLSQLMVWARLSTDSALKLNEITSHLADVANCDYYAQKIISSSRMRTLRESVTRIVQDEKEFKSAAEKVEQVIVSLQGGEWSGLRPLHHYAKEHIAILEHSNISGVNSGVVGLDHKIMGMRPGHIYILGGRPSNGKTMLALKIAIEVAEKIGPVAYFLMETSGQQMAARALTFKTKLPSFKLLRGDSNTQEDWAKIVSESDQFERVPLFIDESSDLSLGTIRPRFTRAKESLDSRLIVIDYLQLVHSKGGSEREKVNAVLETIKPLAKDLGVPIIILSQLSRRAQYERPVTAHFKESGRIEEDADVACLIFRHSEVPKDAMDFKMLDAHFQNAQSIGLINPEIGEELVWLDVAKNRQAGRIGLIPLRFSRSNMQLEEMDLL